MLNTEKNKFVFQQSLIKYKPDAYAISNVKRTVSTTCKTLCDFLKRAYSINNGEELKQKVIEFMHIATEEFVSRGQSDSLLYQLQAINSIIKNPNLINQLSKSIEENIDKPSQNQLYTSNLLRSQQLVLTEAFKFFYELDKYMEDKPKAIQNYYSNVVNKKGKTDMIVSILKQMKSELEHTIKEGLTADMNFLYHFFDMLGLLKEYMSSYNKCSQKFGFQDLDYKLSSDNPDEISLEAVFSKDFLKTLSVQDLAFFYVFWTNRLAKICNSLGSAFLCIDSLNLWDDFSNGYTDYDISDDELIAVLKKNNYLRQLFCNSYNTMSESTTVAKSVEERADKDYTNYYTKLYHFIDKDYRSFFFDSLVNNDFYKDVCFSKFFTNLEMLAYSRKFSTLEPLIKSFLDNPSICKNWGLVRYNYIDKKYVDSLASTNPMLLLSFDIEGFNMPLRFHISKDSLIDLCKQYNSNCIIPEYQGSEDFFVDGDYIPTQILMPILKNHRPIIRDHISSGENTNFWEHLQFLMNGKFPPHLTKKVNTKNKVVQERNPRTYVSLITGEEFVEDKNGFRRIDDNGSR